MRYQDLSISDVDLNLGDDVANGNFIVTTTDELISMTNEIREKNGNTDIVGNNDNEVYYTFYLYFDTTKKEIKLQAECNHGEKDDYVWYDLPLSAEEKETLMFMIIKYFADEEWNR